MAGVEGRVALVTGAGSADGIGFATARLLRARGAKVAITSTTDRIFERLADLGGGQDEIFANTADLTDSALVTGLTEAIEKKLGPIDIVVNNAGMVQIGRDEISKPLHETSDESWRYLMDINLTSVFLVTRALLPGMIKTGSSDAAEIVAGRYTPAGRPGTPDEVGHVAVFLACEEASYVTGQLIVVDGGNTIQEYKVAL